MVLARSRVFRFSSLHIARGDTTRSFPPSPSAASHRGSPSLHIDSAKDISRQPIAFHRRGDTAVYTAIQRVSHRGDQPSFLVADTRSLRSLSCSPLSWRSPASAVILSGATVLFLLEVSRFRPFRRAHPFSYCPLAFGWCGVASRHFRHLPRPSPRWSMPRAPWFFSCGRATAPPVIRSPVHLPRDLRPAPQAHSRPSSSISRFHSRMYCNAFLCSRHSVSGEPRVVQPFILARYPPQGKAYPDPAWSSRSSSLHYPLPGRRIQTTSGPGVHVNSRSAAKKAPPDPGWSSRPSSLAIRRHEGVSGPRVVQPFIFTRHPPPRRRIRIAGGPGVYLHSLSAGRKAYPDRDWSRRSSSLAIRRQEAACGPRVVQPFIVTRYPLPGRRIRTPSGPGVHPHSLSASRKAYRDPEWSSRSSSLALRRQCNGLCANALFAKPNRTTALEKRLVFSALKKTTIVAQIWYNNTGYQIW